MRKNIQPKAVAEYLHWQKEMVRAKVEGGREED